jgi:hypothetical protein
MLQGDRYSLVAAGTCTAISNIASPEIAGEAPTGHCSGIIVYA